MCFGEATTGIKTTDSSQTTTPSPWLTSAAAGNVATAQNLQSTGFQPYTGQQVATFDPQQTASFGLGTNIANAAQPNINASSNALSTYLNNAGNQPTVNAESISSQMSPYMNQYVNMALQPQLQAQQAQQAQNQQLMQGQSTSAGAFGDPRANMLQQNQQQLNTLANQSLVGNAYNAAFNTAIGAGAQDVSNNLNAQTTNAGLYNTGLNELLAGSNAGQSQATNAANLENTFGAQQTAQSQAGLNASYNQWLMAQQYPFQTSQLLDTDLSAAQGVSPTTTTGTNTQTTQAPNNSGWAILGSLLGGGASAALNGSLPGMSSAAAAAPAGVTSGASGIAGQVLAAADGGAIPKGQPTLIGERGPELWVPHEAGTVIPYEKLKAALAKKTSVSTSGLARQLGVAA